MVDPWRPMNFEPGKTAGGEGALIVIPWSEVAWLPSWSRSATGGLAMPPLAKQCRIGGRFQKLLTSFPTRSGRWKVGANKKTSFAGTNSGVATRRRKIPGTGFHGLKPHGCHHEVAPRPWGGNGADLWSLRRFLLGVPRAGTPGWYGSRRWRWG